MLSIFEKYNFEKHNEMIWQNKELKCSIMLPYRPEQPIAIFSPFGDYHCQHTELEGIIIQIKRNNEIENLIN